MHSAVSLVINNRLSPAKRQQIPLMNPPSLLTVAEASKLPGQARMGDKV